MTTVIQQGEVIFFQEEGGLEGGDTEYEIKRHQVRIRLFKYRYVLQ